MPLLPSSLELHLVSLRTPDQSPLLSSTEGSPNHWRHHCDALETTTDRVADDGTFIIEDYKPVPGGDWLVLTLESDHAAPIVLFDGRIQTAWSERVQSFTSTRHELDWIRVAAPIPKIATDDPVCVGLVMTIHGAELAGDTSSDRHFEASGATIVDTDARVFRAEKAWLLVPDAAIPPQHTSRRSPDPARRAIEHTRPCGVTTTFDESNEIACDHASRPAASYTSIRVSD